MRELHQRGDIDLYRFILLPPVAVCKAPRVAEARVVDQHVDGQFVLQRVVENVERGIDDREVDGKDVNADPVVAFKLIFKREQLTRLRTSSRIFGRPGSSVRRGRSGSLPRLRAPSGLIRPNVCSCIPSERSRSGF